MSLSIGKYNSCIFVLISNQNLSWDQWIQHEVTRWDNQNPGEHKMYLPMWFGRTKFIPHLQGITNEFYRDLEIQGLNERTICCCLTSLIFLAWPARRDTLSYLTMWVFICYNLLLALLASIGSSQTWWPKPNGPSRYNPIQGTNLTISALT